MLKERRHCRVAVPNEQYYANRVPHRSNIVPLDDVGIVPGNRFILLPLKKVTTVVSRHRWCRSSAISTKASIVRKSRMVSQRALFQTPPPTNIGAVSIGGSVVPGLRDKLHPVSVRFSNRLASSRASLKQIRYSQCASIVRTCLPPVLECQVQGDVNCFVKEFLPDQGNWSQEKSQQLGKFKFGQSLHNANDTNVSQTNSKRIENERILENQVCELADILPTSSMSRLCGNSLWSEDGVHEQREDFHGQEENGLGLDANHNYVGNTRSYDISIGAGPDLCASKSVAGRTHRICGDGSVLHQSPSLEEAQQVCPLLKRHLGRIRRPASTIDYLSFALIESNTNSNRSKARLIHQQPSSRTSSGSILVPLPACFGELLKGRDDILDRKGAKLELRGATQRALRNRIRQSPGDSPQDSDLPVFDQFVTKKPQSFKNRVTDELQCKAHLCAKRNSAVNQGGSSGRAAGALEQENVLRGDQQTMGTTHLRGRANKKLGKVYLKIQALGRNRVSPSWLVGHKFTSHVKSIDEQFLLAPQTLESPLEGVGGLDKCKVKRSERYRNRYERFRGDRSSEVTCAAVLTREYLKGFLCSFVGDDNLPIGPLHMFEEQLLLN